MAKRPKHPYGSTFEQQLAADPVYQSQLKKMGTKHYGIQASSLATNNKQAYMKNFMRTGNIYGIGNSRYGRGGAAAGFEYESMGSGAGGAGSGSGGDSGRPMDVQSLYRRTLDEMRKAQLEAKAANKAREMELRGGYDKRYGDVMGQLEGMGAQEASDIRQNWWDRGSQTQADLQARGLAGTTIAPTMAAGNTRMMNADQARLQERLRRERLGYMSGMQKEKLDFIERITDAYPDPSMNVQLLRDMAQYSQGQARSPRGATGRYGFSSSTPLFRVSTATNSNRKMSAPRSTRTVRGSQRQATKEPIKGSGFKGATMAGPVGGVMKPMTAAAVEARRKAGLTPNPLAESKTIWTNRGSVPNPHYGKPAISLDRRTVLGYGEGVASGPQRNAVTPQVYRPPAIQMLPNYMGMIPNPVSRYYR